MSNDPIQSPGTDPESFGLMGTTDAILFSGLSAAVLRRYESDGLIRPLRTARGARLYRMSDLDRAKQIYKSRLQRHGATGQRRATAL